MKKVIFALVIFSCSTSANDLFAQHKSRSAQKTNQTKPSKSASSNTQQTAKTPVAVVDGDSVQLVTLRKKVEAGKAAKAEPVAAAVIEDEGQKIANFKQLIESQSEGINQLKKEIDAKISGIQSSKTMSPEQKKLKLAQYQEILKLKLTLMLGEEGYQYYIQTKGN